MAKRYLYLSTGADRLTFNYRGVTEDDDVELARYAYWQAAAGLEVCVMPHLVLQGGKKSTKDIPAGHKGESATTQGLSRADLKLEFPPRRAEVRHPTPGNRGRKQKTFVLRGV